MQDAKKLNQTYTFVTVELAADKIAFDIKQNSPPPHLGRRGLMVYDYFSLRADIVWTRDHQT